MQSRSEVLKANQAMREGVTPAPTRLEDGFAHMRIPTGDWPVLIKVIPGLVSKDAAERRAAWDHLANSALGELYMVVRTPRQVKRSPGGIIIK